ncbi:MAG TPA: hypothetical protein VH165_28805, partial [Kofleriaceae bacterium]|nr:hypothetical protein [Kofleriaceae bacterium]
MQNKSAFPALLFFVIFAAGGALAFALYNPLHPAGTVIMGCVAFAVAVIVSRSVNSATSSA